MITRHVIYIVITYCVARALLENGWFPPFDIRRDRKIALPRRGFTFRRDLRNEYRAAIIIFERDSRRAVGKIIGACRSRGHIFSFVVPRIRGDTSARGEGDRRVKSRPRVHFLRASLRLRKPERPTRIRHRSAPSHRRSRSSPVALGRKREEVFRVEVFLPSFSEALRFREPRGRAFDSSSRKSD